MIRRARQHFLSLGLGFGLFGVSSWASAQDLGKPPPEAEKAVVGPGKAAGAPKIVSAPEGVNASVSAGGLSSSGNSRLVAFTGSGVFDWRGGDNGVGASFVGNFGKSAPPGGEMQTTTQNAQGRVRYDRYVLDDASVFLLVTGRHRSLSRSGVSAQPRPWIQVLVRKSSRHRALGGSRLRFSVRHSH